MTRFLLFIFLLIGTVGLAQNKDAVGWTGFGLELPVTKKLGVDFESQLRLDQNMTRYSQLYGEVAVSYEVVKRLNVGGLYRYSRKNNGDYFFNANRLTIFAKYRVKTEMGIDIDFKTRFQHTFDRFSVVNDIYPERKNIWRLSAKVKYTNENFRRLQPYVSTEMFHSISPKNPTSFLDTYRLRVGVVVDLPKRFEINAFYMFEHENRSVDNQFHIYCIQVNYLFKKLIKSKKDSGTDIMPEED